MPNIQRARCARSARRCAIIMRAVVMPACGLGTQDVNTSTHALAGEFGSYARLRAWYARR